MSGVEIYWHRAASEKAGEGKSGPPLYIGLAGALLSNKKVSSSIYAISPFRSSCTSARSRHMSLPYYDRVFSNFMRGPKQNLRGPKWLLPTLP